jgi:hypothetical protein
MPDITHPNLTTAQKFRAQAAALEAAQTTVPVQLSLPLVWLIRDMVGMERLSERSSLVGGYGAVGFRADLERLNAALGYREDKEIAVWSAAASRKVVSP